MTTLWAFAKGALMLVAMVLRWAGTDALWRRVFGLGHDAGALGGCGGGCMCTRRLLGKCDGKGKEQGQQAEQTAG